VAGSDASAGEVADHLDGDLHVTTCLTSPAGWRPLDQGYDLVMRLGRPNQRQDAAAAAAAPSKIANTPDRLGARAYGLPISGCSLKEPTAAKWWPISTSMATATFPPALASSRELGSAR